MIRFEIGKHYFYNNVAKSEVEFVEKDNTTFKNCDAYIFKVIKTYTTWHNQRDLIILKDWQTVKCIQELANQQIDTISDI